MISKKKMVFISIAVAMITGTAGVFASKFIGLPLGSTVLVSKDEYSELVDIYDKYGKLDVMEDYIENNYLGDYKRQAVVDGAIKGMFGSLDDPYSVYMDADEFKQFTDANSGSFVGVGIVVSQNEEDMIEIVSPMEGTPGYEAGLKPGDKIIKVDGVEYSGSQLDVAVSNMKGEKGTKVKLTILRENSDGKQETIEKEIVRDKIEVESVKSEIIDGSIGYIRLSSFDETSYDDFKEHLEALKAKNIDSLVLDLRGNGGGSVSVCADIADEILGEGTIVYTEDKAGSREYLKSDSRKLGLPLAVVVDGSSASASEILTAAIQDMKAGTVVGTKTYGKGVIQIVNDLPDGSGFKLTISEYFSPEGKRINKKGVTPDVVVELPEETEAIGVDALDQDTQLQKAIEILKTAR